MLAYSGTSSGLFPRMLWALLLLAASLNATKEDWDHPSCTEHEVSVHRGDRVVMACNVSTAFREVTIELAACGETTTIFNQKPPGNHSKDSWQLQIQGGQAQLVITDAQGIHAGVYLWTLCGFQRNYPNFTLNVTDPATDNQEPESLRVHAESLTAERTEVIFIIIITTTIIPIIIGISAFAWYKRRHSPKLHRQVSALSNESPGKSYLPLP